MSTDNALSQLHSFYATESIPANISDIIQNECKVSLTAHYAGLPLKNPLLVAPGSATVNTTQMTSIRNAGFAGAVLKSVVGEAADGSCSMISQRKKPTSVKTFFEPDDVDGECPIIHWDGRLDHRPLAEYVAFARESLCLQDSAAFQPIASFLCHLPFPGEEFIKDEWSYTTKVFQELGYSHIEIDFCPFLAGDNYTEDQQNVLRWYRTCTRFMKSTAPEVQVFPKILNLEWGLEFQLQMAEAAVAGGADGLVIANRMYKPEYKSGHGGEELRQRNLAQIRGIKERFPSLAISATGGVYSGQHVYEYLQAGAENVQLLSYIMGNVKKPFAKTNGTKLEKVFHRLLLDPEDGLVSCIIRQGPWNE